MSTVCIQRKIWGLDTCSVSTCLSTFHFLIFEDTWKQAWMESRFRDEETVVVNRGDETNWKVCVTGWPGMQDHSYYIFQK